MVSGRFALARPLQRRPAATGRLRQHHQSREPDQPLGPALHALIAAAHPDGAPIAPLRPRSPRPPATTSLPTCRTASPTSPISGTRPASSPSVDASYGSEIEDENSATVTQRTGTNT